MDKLSDPKYIGPGKWDTFMIECAEARTVDKQKRVAEFVRRQIDNFRCECKEHAIDYLKKHPIEKMIGYQIQGEMVGLLIWMWGFHNNVNFRLNKKYCPTWKEVYNYYWLKNSVIGKPCVAIQECADDVKLVREKIEFIISDRS